LLGTLGRGGMASVYRAFDRVQQRIVALKVQADPEQAGPAHPLSAEFDFLTRLRHPNVVSVYDLGVARSGPLRRGAPYLVMEHARGRPAAEVLPPGGVSPSTLEQFAVQVLRGLGHVHASGLIHRDLKPSNLLTEMTGARLRGVKLADFGLAARAGLAEEPGKVSGSLPYVSPEALLGLPLDARSDLYGLGIALFVLAAGRLPCGAGGVEEVLRWHLGGPPADPRQVRPSLPDRLARLVRRLTRRDPAERPSGADQALAMLGVNGRTARRDGRLAAGRAERASLRLALDAVRLGARRRFILPAVREQASSLLREIRVWCQVRGIGFHRLRTGTTHGEQSVAEMVLRLLIDRDAGAGRLMRRYGIRRWLPLGLLGGFPVREHGGARRGDGPAAVAGGRQLGGFVIACSADRPLVLSIERHARPDPLLQAVAAELRREVEPPRPPCPGAGGLLLLE
jgi:hypothetical protein